MKTEFSVIVPDELHQQLFAHLIRTDGQEDLCFATYVPSTGKKRMTGIISTVILPESGDRELHGDVGFMPQYLERALQIARERKEGLVFLHSHLGPGWQNMSPPDVVAENRIAPAIQAATGLPLLGMTLGTDGSWSARFWLKNESQKRKYDRHWCATVRVMSKKLSLTYHDVLLPPCFDTCKQLRTISAWGTKKQEDLSRLHIGIVGLGSVGSIVAEILARTGIARFTLIDFDSVEEKNLDRLTNVFEHHIGIAKVLAIAEGIRKSATAPAVSINCCQYSICEKEGFEQALDCDILFSCVDRPWPRQVLNFVAYAHLIPVIDGGIFVRSNKRNTNIAGAEWKVQTIGYQRPCLECLGQYKAENVSLEMSGLMDDPEYIKTWDQAKVVNAHENVYAFSSHLASMEVLQMLSLVLSPSSISDVGQQLYHFTLGTLDIEIKKDCHENCFFPSVVGKGDFARVTVYARHKVAEDSRDIRSKICMQKGVSCNHTKKENFLLSVLRKLSLLFKVSK